MIEQVKKLGVKYNGVTVGYLAEVQDGRIAFQYDSKWLKNGFSISPFSLPLSNQIYINGKDNFGGIYGVFHDSLPDGWGELLVKRMLAKMGVNYDSLSPLTKLSLVSGNGLGGLTYEPTQVQKEQDSDIDLDLIAREADKILNDGASGESLDEIYRLGGSSGGARPKAHLHIDGDEWIVKFPCRLDPVNVGEEEYKANLLAKECGIKIAECRLFPSERCTGYFGSKRFDRIGEKRVHTVSLSSLLETSHRIPNLDYMHLFQVIQKICVDQDDLYEAYRRMCFNVIYGNKDDHGKNFSFIYDEHKNGYRLSPAYDITRTPDKAEHEMTVRGSVNPSKEELEKFAEVVGMQKKKCQEILDRIMLKIEKPDIEVVAALIWEKDKFLICQRPSNKSRGLLWEFVGGKVEKGETKEQALIRECQEELAITVEPYDVFMEVIHEYPDMNVYLTLFKCTILHGEPKLLEHNDIKWITPAEISNYEFCPADVEILKKISDFK